MRCNGLTCWIASRITPAASLLNSSVGISRSLDGDDAYVTDRISIFYLYVNLYLITAAYLSIDTTTTCYLPKRVISNFAIHTAVSCG